MSFLASLRGAPKVGDGPNTVSESTVSNTELSEFFRAHWVPGSELSEFLSAYYLCANANSPSFSQNSPSLLQNSVSSLFRNSTLETVFRPFPKRSGEGVLRRNGCVQKGVLESPFLLCPLKVVRCFKQTLRGQRRNGLSKDGLLDNRFSARRLLRSFSAPRSLNSGEWTQWVPFSLLFVCQSKLTELFAELTEFAAELSEFSLPKQNSRNSILPVSFSLTLLTYKHS